MMAYNVLGKLKWAGELKSCEIIIRHRGAPNDKKTIQGKNITEVKKSYFLYTNDRETFIPLHRILEINVKGKLIWKKKSYETED